MVCPDRWLGAVPKRPSSCVWTLGVTSTNVPPSPATFWPFAAANRQNAIATRARPRPGRGGATPREGPEPPRADEAERADISRLCRRDIHFRHLTGQRRASSVCPFFLLIMSLFGVVFTASFGNAKRKNGGRPEATRCAQTTEGVFVCLSLFPHRVSYERQSHENSFCTFSFFETSTLRGRRRIFRFHSHRIPTRRHLPGASSRTPHPLAVPGSSSSSLEVERISLELLCSAPQRSRLRPKSTDCPFPRLLGSLASPPPGPPVRAPFSVSGARTLPAIASRVARLKTNERYRFPFYYRATGMMKCT